MALISRLNPVNDQKYGGNSVNILFFLLYWQGIEEPTIDSYTVSPRGSDFSWLGQISDLFFKIMKIRSAFSQKSLLFAKKIPKSQIFYFSPTKKCFIAFLVVHCIINHGMVVVWSGFLFWFHGVHTWKSVTICFFLAPEVPLCPELSMILYSSMVSVLGYLYCIVLI